MGSSEVINILRKKGELTAKEIAELINKTKESVNVVLKNLLKDPFDPVDYRELTKEEKLEKYNRNVQVKVRIYHIKK